MIEQPYVPWEFPVIVVTVAFTSMAAIILDMFRPYFVCIDANGRYIPLPP